MPDGLDHWPGFDEDQPFDAMKSELCNWMVQQPEIRSYIVSRLRHLGLIRYDRESSTWKRVTGIVSKAKEAMAAGKDIGKPFIYRPKDLLVLLGDSKMSAKQWFKLASQEYGISRAQFFRHIKILSDIEAVSKNPMNALWKVTTGQTQNQLPGQSGLAEPTPLQKVLQERQDAVDRPDAVPGAATSPKADSCSPTAPSQAV